MQELTLADLIEGIAENNAIIAAAVAEIKAATDEIERRG